jgi:hypothetical protein
MKSHPEVTGEGKDKVTYISLLDKRVLGTEEVRECEHSSKPSSWPGNVTIAVRCPETVKPGNSLDGMHPRPG